MSAPSRSQLLVYGAVALTLLLVGARWIRSGDAAGSAAGGVSYGSEGRSGAGGPPGDSFSVSDGGGEDVVVHVAGEVRSPGVYRLPAGSRVTDAVERAGGGTSRADLDAINLAARLADGQQVLLPATAVGPDGVMQGAAGTGTAAADAPISLGSATLEELDTIEGIGPVTAQNIIDFREAHGGVSSVDELDQIDGIGPATLDALRARLQP